MKTVFRLLPFAVAFAFPSACAAQTAATSTDSSTRNDAYQTLERGRVLLSINDARALPILREVARRALSDFQAQPQNAVQKDAAVTACLWWGKAAQTFNVRDEAIEAWAQGLATIRTFADANSFSNVAVSADERDLRALLNTVLLDGLPLRATTQTLQTLSVEVAKSSWKPTLDTFKIPNLGLPIEYSKVASANAPDATSREFLITSGTLSLSNVRTPSLYASFDAATLPTTLKMNRAVVGYARDGDVWQQKVRVLYCLVDDAEQTRAEEVTAQFLRVQSLYDNFLGQTNRYATDGVTTLWLTRQSAEWPQTSPADNWSAGAWIDSAPDQMILFRSGEARPEAEWLRETAHEYSHIALPPFAGFELPLEPFGNGRIGETLTMLWADASPSSFFSSDEQSEAQKNCEVHVQRHAIPALMTWLKTDPAKPLSLSGDQNALNQLLGLAIEIERVYGADVLRRSLNAASNGNYATWRESGIEYSMRRTTTRKPMVLHASDLLRAFQNVMHVVPANTAIWLTGALQHRSASGSIIDFLPDELARRAPLVLKAGESATGWIYFPTNAKTLRLDYKDLSSNKAAAAQTIIQIEGDWKTTITRHTLTIAVGRRTGWQKITVRAVRAATLNGAQFERNAL